MATAAEPTSLLKDAALIVDVCMSVEEDDVVTIICDDDHVSQAAAIAKVVVERGGWPVVMNNEVQVRRGRADVRFPMATTYQVEVPAGTKSATGGVLKDAVKFTFETPAPRNLAVSFTTSRASSSPSCAASYTVCAVIFEVSPPT